MRRPRSLNASTAGSFPFLLVLVVTSSFLSGRCLATTDSHHRRPPAGRHGPPRPVSPPSPPATTFSVLQYGAVGDGDKDDTKASAECRHTHIHSRLILHTLIVMCKFMVGDVLVCAVFQAFVHAWSAACAVRSSTVVVPAGYRFVVGPVTFTGDSCQPNTVFQVSFDRYMYVLRVPLVKQNWTARFFGSAYQRQRACNKIQMLARVMTWGLRTRICWLCKAVLAILSRRHPTI